MLATLVLTCLAAGLLIASAAPPAAACSCEARDDAALFADATAVFVGEVTGRFDPRAGEPTRSSTDPVTLTFRVADVFKGDVRRTQEVVTGLDGASCGLGELQAGTRPQLVFATADVEPTVEEPPAPRRFSIHLCGGTRDLASGALASGLAEARPPLDDPPPATSEPSAPARQPGATLWLTGAALLAVAGVFAVARSRRHG